jgi:hypothetical protein
MYFYNGDNNDEASFSSLGYGIDPPAIGIVGLKENMTSSSYYMNGGGNQISEKWNIMNGLQFSGDPWLDPTGNETSYLYSGNPNIPTEWCEISNGNLPGDRRGISSLNVGQFNNGDTLFQTYAISYSRVGNNLENVQSIIDLAGALKTFYENESDIPCQNGTWNVNEIETFQLTIESSSLIEQLEFYDLTGRNLAKYTGIQSTHFDVDCRFLHSGNYLVKVSSEGKTAVRQVRVQ